MADTFPCFPYIDESLGGCTAVPIVEKKKKEEWGVVLRDIRRHYASPVDVRSRAPPECCVSFVDDGINRSTFGLIIVSHVFDGLGTSGHICSLSLYDPAHVARWEPKNLHDVIDWTFVWVVCICIINEILDPAHLITAG